jgi:predicted dehydrogenase
VAIADPSRESAERRAEKFGIPSIYSDARAMLDAEQLDIVDIAAPREFHAELVALAARRGLDIVCQKPLATNFALAQEMVADLPANTRLMVHENWRFRACYRRLKQWLDEGLAGDVRQVSLEFLSSGMILSGGQRPALVRQPFFSGQQRLLVMEVLIHQLDTLRYLLGEMDVVAARLDRSNDDIVAEDMASITLRCRTGGVLVQLTGNLAVHGQPPTPSDRLRIFGSNGTLELDGNRLSAAGIVQRKEFFDTDVTYQGAYDAAIVHFVDGLDAGGRFDTAPGDNLETLKLVEDIYAASQFDPSNNRP